MSPDRIQYQCESGHWSISSKRLTNCTARSCTVEGPYGPECGAEIFNVSVDSDYYFEMLDEIERLRGLVREMHIYRPETFVHPTTIMWTAATCSCDDWDTLSVGVEAREAHADAHVAKILDGTP